MVQALEWLLVLEHDQSLLRRIDAQGNRLVGQVVGDGIGMQIDTYQLPCVDGMHHAPTITGLQPVIGIDLRLRCRQGWQALERCQRRAVAAGEGLIGPLLPLLDPADQHAASGGQLGLHQVGVQSQQALLVASCGMAYCFPRGSLLAETFDGYSSNGPSFFTLFISL